MEFLREFFPPAVVVGLVGTLIGVIVKLTRILTRIERLEEAMEEVCIEVSEARKEFTEHTQQKEVHFDMRLAREIEGRHNDRFNRVEADLKEIKDMVREVLKR